MLRTKLTKKCHRPIVEKYQKGTVKDHPNTQKLYQVHEGER